MSANLAQKSRLDLDWLRGLAVALVVISHLFLFYPAVNSSIGFLSNGGHIGVEIFFVLSGFLISLSWHFDQNYSRFLLKRSRRILPLMWVVMSCIFFILTPIFLEWSLFTPSHIFVIFVHLIGLQSLIPAQIPGLFIGVPLWTLTIEICFYVSLPFLWDLFIHRPAAFVVASLFIEISWAIGAEAAAAYFNMSEQWSLYLPEQLPGQMFSFSLGMLMASFFIKGKHVARFPRRAVIFVGLIALLFGLCYFDEISRLGLSSILFPVVAAAIIWASLISERHLCGVLGVRAPHLFHTTFSSLGRISYSLYLWHFLVLFALYRVTLGDVPFSLFALIGCGASLAISILSFNLIEKPLSSNFAIKGKIS